MLFSHLQEASLSDPHAWLEQLMRKDKAVGEQRVWTAVEASRHCGHSSTATSLSCEKFGFVGTASHHVCHAPELAMSLHDLQQPLHHAV